MGSRGRLPSQIGLPSHGPTDSRLQPVGRPLVLMAAGVQRDLDAARERLGAASDELALVRAALDQPQSEARRAAQAAEALRRAPRTPGGRGGLWRGSGRRGGGVGGVSGRRRGPQRRTAGSPPPPLASVSIGTIGRLPALPPAEAGFYCAAP
jgi:hypothetical protein